MKKSTTSYKSAALVVYLVMFLEGCSTIMIPANKEPIMAHFSVGIEEISTLIAIRGLISGLLPFVFGGLSDRLGRKRIIAVGLALFAVYYVAVPFLPVFFPLLPLTVLLGSAHSLTDPSSQAVLFDVYGDPSAQMPIIQVTYSMGAILMPMLVGMALLRGYSWKLSFFLIFAVAAGLLALTLARRFPPKTHSRASHPAQQAHTFPHIQPRAMREGLCLFLFVVANLVFVTLVSNWVDLYMKEVFHFPESSAVMVLGCYQVGCIAGALLFVALLRRLHTTQVMLYFSIASLAIFLLCLVTASPVVFIVLVVLLAACSGAFFSIAISYSGNLFRAHAGAASGAISSASSVGAAGASVLAGRLIPLMGVRSLFLLLPAVLGVSILLALLIRRQYKRLLGAGENPA